MTTAERPRLPKAVLLAFGVVAGLLGLVVGYTLVGLVVHPYTDAMLVGIAVAPPVVLALGAVVPRWRRFALLLALGALIGIVVAVAVLVGGITFVAGMLSDPVGPPPR